MEKTEILELENFQSDLRKFLESFENKNPDEITAKNLVREFLKKYPQYQKIEKELLKIFEKK